MSTSPTSRSEEIFDEIRRFPNPRTGYDLRGVSYDGCGETPLQWPVSARRRPSDRHPIRYLNDGVSQDLFVDADGHRPRLAFPTPSRRAVFLARPHMAAAELPDDDYPLVLNTGRLQHQWHTMTKTGKVDKLNKLNPGPFVEIHPDDADALGIADGEQVEIASRRGRAVLPAVVTDRVRPGNCFVPFHWNDEHGEYLTINAVTNDAVDPDSLQPEFKVCAVALRPVEPVANSAPSVLDRLHRPLTDDEKHLPEQASSPVLGERPARGTGAAAAGAAAQRRSGCGSTGCWPGCTRAAERCAPPRNRRERRGPLVLWASQTGNAEEFAGRLAAAGWATHGCVSMDDVDAGDLAAAREVLIVTSTFGDGGPPDNGADFWDRLGRADAPRARRGAVRGARHRRPLLRRLLRARQVAGRATGRSRCDQAAGPRRMRGRRRRADGRSGPTGRRPGRCACSPRLGGSTVRHRSPNRSPAPHPVHRAAVPQQRADPRRVGEGGAPVRVSTSPSTASPTRPATRWACVAANDRCRGRRLARGDRARRDGDRRGRRR